MYLWKIFENIIGNGAFAQNEQNLCSFLYACLLTGRIMGTPAGGWCPPMLSTLIIKSSPYLVKVFVGIMFWPSSITSQIAPGIFWIMALYLSKIGEIGLFRSLSQTVFMQSSLNLVKMFVVIMSGPSSITSQIAPCIFGLWPFNYPKLVKLIINSFEGLFCDSLQLLFHIVFL